MPMTSSPSTARKRI